LYGHLSSVLRTISKIITNIRKRNRLFPAFRRPGQAGSTEPNRLKRPRSPCPVFWLYIAIYLLNRKERVRQGLGRTYPQLACFGIGHHSPPPPCAWAISCSRQRPWLKSEAKPKQALLDAHRPRPGPGPGGLGSGGIGLEEGLQRLVPSARALLQN
jgi:hypothetical protein